MISTSFLQDDLVYRLLTRGKDLTSLKNAEFVFVHNNLEVDVDNNELTMNELRQNFSSFIVIQNGAEVSNDAFNPNSETLALLPLENGNSQVFVVCA